MSIDFKALGGSVENVGETPQTTGKINFAELGGEILSEPKEGFIKRTLKQIYNTAVASPVQAVGTKSEFGKALTDAEALNVIREDLHQKVFTYQPITKAEYKELQSYGSPYKKGTFGSLFGMKPDEWAVKALEDVKEGKLKVISGESQVDLADVYKRAEANRLKDADISAAVSEAQGFKDKAADVIGGVTGFVAQLTLLRKAFPGVPEPLIWELQNEATGGTAGKGVVTYATFNAAGKLGNTLSGKIAAKGIIGKLGKTAAKIAPQSAAMGGIAAAGGGSLEDVAIAAGIPAGMALVGVAGKASNKAALERTLGKGTSEPLPKTTTVSERFKQLVAERDNFKPQSPEWNKLNEEIALETEAMRPKATPVQESQAKALRDLPLSGEEVVGQKMVQTAADLANVGQAKPVAKVEPATIESISKKAATNVEDVKKYTVGLREPAVKELRAQQATAYESIMKQEIAKGTPPAEALQKAREGMRGKAETFKVPSPNFNPEEMNVISDKIIGKYKDVFKVNNAKEAFDAWNKGEVLQRGQFQYIEGILGKKVATSLYDSQEVMRAKSYGILGLENDIQAAAKLIVSLDVQIARQASTIALRHPVLFAKAVGVNARAYVSEKYAENIEAKTRASKYYEQASNDGINRLTTTAYSGERAEQFSLSTHLTQKLSHAGETAGPIGKALGSPLRALGKITRGAERGFAAAHDYLVQSMYDTAMSEFEKAGLPVTPKMQAEFTQRASQGDVAAREALAKAQLYRTNRASAINTLVKVLRAKNPDMKKVQKAANHVLFSASVTTARFKIFSDAVTKAGSRAYIGSAIATDIAKMILVSSITTLIGKELASKYEWARKKDGSPKLYSDNNILSSNWGKIVVGDSSFDLGGGEIQKYRFLAKLIASKTKTQAGEIKEVPRTDIIEQYLKGRGNPVLGLVARWWTGTDFMGKDIWEMPDLAPYAAGEKGPLGKQFAGEVQGIQKALGEKAGKGVYLAGREIANALAPQILSATWEAAIDQGWAQTLSRGLAETFSQGTNEVTEYASTAVTKMKNKLAEEKYSKKWDDLSDAQQKQLRGYSTSLKELEKEAAKVKPNNYEYVGETIKQQAEIGKKVQRGLDKDIQTQMTSLGVSVGGLSKNIGDWKLNDARYKAYQETVKEVLNPRLREIMDRPMWSSMSDEQKVKAIKTQVDKAKEIARNKIKGAARNG